LQDKSSKIIFLEKFLRSSKYYKLKKTNRKKIFGKSFSVINKNNQIIKTPNLQDDQRRYNQFKKYLLNKNILDYGCGSGEFITKALKIARKCSAVEVNKYYIDRLESKINIKKNIELFEEKFDCITMFHVLEHIPFQVEIINLDHYYL